MYSCFPLSIMRRGDRLVVGLLVCGCIFAGFLFLQKGNHGVSGGVSPAMSALEQAQQQARDSLERQRKQVGL